MSNRKYRHFFYVPQSVYIYFIEMKRLSRDDQWSYYNVSIDILIQSSKIINYIFKSTAPCETALSYTKQTTINKQILCRFQKKFFQRSKKWHSPSFFRCFAPCRAFLWAKKLSCSVVLRPKNAQTFIGRHFFFSPLIYQCLKSQLSK